MIYSKCHGKLNQLFSLKKWGGGGGGWMAQFFLGEEVLGRAQPNSVGFLWDWDGCQGPGISISGRKKVIGKL